MYIPKIWQILKYFTKAFGQGNRTFHQALTSYLEANETEKLIRNFKLNVKTKQKLLLPKSKFGKICFIFRLLMIL